MFGTNFFPDSLEGFRNGFIPGDFPSYMVPNFDQFNSDLFSKDFFNSLPPLSDLDGFDQKSFIQMFDEGMKSIPEEMKSWLPIPFDFMMGPLGDSNMPTQITMPQRAKVYSTSQKIGSISSEERRVKVLKFLEKRKVRNYKKKISYMCRKKVADQRIRVKGRFVSKTQADAILDEKSTE